MSHNQLFLPKLVKKAKYTFISTLLLTFYFINYVIEWWSHITYYPITIYSTTIYSKFIEQLLILHHVSYLQICKPYIQYPHYHTNNLKEVSIYPFSNQFDNQLINITPLSDEELILMEEKFNMVNLKDRQEEIIQVLPQINAFQIIKENYIESEDYHYTINKIINVQKINNLYCIKTDRHYIYTSIILTDHTAPLTCGDILNLTYYDKEKDVILINNKYIYNDNHKLVALSKGKHKNLESTPFYSLEEPRQKLILHPFHFPKISDFILGVMIITQSILHHIL